jgi:hypothetical protein
VNKPRQTKQQSNLSSDIFTDNSDDETAKMRFARILAGAGLGALVGRFGGIAKELVLVFCNPQEVSWQLELVGL